MGVTIIRIALARVTRSGSYLSESYPDGYDEPAISSIGYELIRWELPGVGVILVGVTIVRTYPGRSYPDDGDEPAISSTGYETVGSSASFDKLNVELGNF